MGDLVGSWDAKEAEGVGVVDRGGKIGEETEKIFGIQLATTKGTGNIDTTLDVLSQ